MTMLSTFTFELGSLSYIGLFLGALLIYEGLWQLLSRGDAQKAARSRRMKMLATGASSRDVLQVLKPVSKGWRLRGLPMVSQLPRDMRQAGISLDPVVAALSFGAAAAVSTALLSIYLGPLTATLASLVLWILLPLALVGRLRRKRLALFDKQLPDALELMARGLRVGHPLNVTINSVAEEMSDPIASEFGVVVDQVAYGETLVDAVLDLADRIGTEDVRYLATSISIQNGTGGDMARMLGTLSRVIRDRMALRQKVRSISAEGRLSAMLLTAIPFLMIGLMQVVTPEYYGDVMTDPAFKPTVAVVLVLLLANGLVLRRLVNFRV